jgi:D-glycero-D-manno-heptose 1,7-bisphosphate phosphatase
LDRDGVINIDKHYLYKIEDFEFTKGIFDFLKWSIFNNYILIIVTNQSGIGRGYYTHDDFEKLTNWMVDRLKQNGILISKVSYCPHTPEDLCDCRKPHSKMFLDAKEEFDIDMKSSWMIGDKESDIEAAQNAKVENTILLTNTDKPTKAKYSVDSIRKLKEVFV